MSSDTPYTDNAMFKGRMAARDEMVVTAEFCRTMEIEMRKHLAKRLELELILGKIKKETEKL